MNIGIISHPDCVLHDMGLGHPESPDRIRAIEKALKTSDISNQLTFYQAIPATVTQLTRAHSKEYVNWIFKKAPEQGHVALDPDTIMNSFTLQAALLAAGSLVQAVDLIMQKKEKVIFCNIRPPGHHAERDRAMGFCFFNNLAIGVCHALEHYKRSKIAIIDFDVHHGNGTEDILQRDKRVLFCSSYQYPFYPYSQVVNDNPHILHMPLKAGTEGATFRTRVTDEWLPAIHQFEPEFIFVSAGFDAHRDDLLGGLKLKEEDYFWVSRMIRDLANQYCQGRIVSTLEGGYELNALGASVVAHIKGLMTTAP